MKVWSMQTSCLAIAAAFIASGALAQAPKYTKEQEQATMTLLKQGCGGDVLKAFAGKPDKEEKNDEGGEVILERTYGGNMIAISEKDQKVLATVVRDQKAPEPFKKHLGLDRAALEKQYGLPHIEYRLTSSVGYVGDAEQVNIRLENGKVQEVEWNCSAGGEEGAQPKSQ